MATQKPNYSEEDLVGALKQNDRQAFEYLYEHYAGALFSVITKVLRNDEKAEDVMQDAFLKIWKNISSYDPGKGRLFTWMLNIARNSAIDAVRSEKRQPGMDDITENIDRTDHNAIYQPSPSTLDLKALVDTLRPERKILLDLVYFQGYTQEEAAKELDVPLGTVKSRIRTALKDLKHYFKI